MKRTSIYQSLTLALAMIVCTSGFGVEPLRTNGPSFRIPFAIDQAKAGSSATAILFASKDGEPMEPVQRVSASERSFYFLAPGDGKFQFAVRMVDPQGNLIGEDGPLVPELEVIVDSQAPTIQLQLSEVSAGEAVLQWSFPDEDVDPSSLKMEYLDSSTGQWQPVSPGFPGFGSTANRAKLSSNPGQSIAVRASVKDKAGNTGTASSQIVLTASGKGAAGHPSIGRPTSNPSNAFGHQGLSIPSGNGVVLGSSPFASNNGPASASSAAAPANAAVQNNVSQQPTIGRPVSLNQQTQQQVPMLAIPGSDQAAVSGNAPTAIVSRQGQQSAQYPGTQSAVGSEMDVQHLNNRLFDLDYEIDSVGPSGVSTVTLYVTEDNGRNWFKYGVDKDLKSPFKVDTRGEGMFGFAVRVKNGVGFSDPPPQPGEQPSVVVSVDQTPPTLRLATPQLSAQGQGIVRLNWDIQETNPADEAVRLEYAVSTEGPWSPVFDWQSNPGGFELPISTSMPPSMHFRLLARDAAGNVSSTQTVRPVIIDRNRPKARVLSVKPVSSTQRF